MAREITSSILPASSNTLRIPERGVIIAVRDNLIDAS
jgi:hypothetical protein